jgi:peptide/nickel transport system permease protein
LSERQIIVRHALRMSLITLVSMFGLDFGALVGGGALLIEVVSSLPGVGMLTYQALQNVDLPFIMATVMYGAIFIVVANTAVDMLYVVIDARARDAQ